MAQTILRLGGDVNTQRPSAKEIRQTPLAIAAFLGHEKMIKVLLEAGASHFINEMRIPLAAAIAKQHEAVALILSQGLHPSEVILKINTKRTALQIACKVKFVNLVRYYLERGSKRGEIVNFQSNDCSTALCIVLQEDASSDDIVRRELHEDVYQIVSMLLQHGANPDIYIKIGLSHPGTARAIASRHPDPRVRILVAKPTSATELRGSNLLIGRPWIVSSEHKAHTIHELQSETSPSEASHYARLWDFMERPNAETSDLLEEYGAEYQGTNHEDCILSASDIADLEKGGMQWLKKESESIEPPPLSSFPQLCIPKASVQHISKDFWAKIPAKASLGVHSAQTPSSGGTDFISQKVKQPKKLVETDPFPRLGHTTLTSNDTGTDLWARFAKDRVSQSATETQRTSPSKEGAGVISVQTPSKKKKKKWEPLLV
jgi:ankyrin repeat protein